MKTDSTLRLAALCGAFLASSLIAPLHAHDVQRSPVPTPVHDRPVVQLALLLDTSSSMDGLIDQARTRLWQVVNDLARARQDGRRARLEVALYEYGNNRLSPASGYIRQVISFTDDLDRLSAELFSLSTNGGSEYCGAVIERAVQDLRWSHRARDLKLVFIAGNEPFTQGPVEFRDAIRRAMARGIAINTIFCGPREQGIRTGWQEGAMLADGSYAVINQDRRDPVIDCPQDREIAHLNDALNRTYLAYGSDGRKRLEMQAAQDRQAAAASPSVAAERAAAKSSGLYHNRSWDLVDAVKDGHVDPDALAEEDLPDEFKGKSAEERRQLIAAAEAERQRIQERIQQLNSERAAYIAAERAKLPAEAGAALDEAILHSVRAQAAKVGYAFE